MKQLYIIRHAKSGYPEEVIDKERPLSNRGLNDTESIGNYLSKIITSPELILCSSATRTRQTAKHIIQHTKWDSKITYLDDLYHANLRTLLDLITNTDESVSSLLVIGHNPGLTYLYNQLSINSLDNLPTCGFASFEITEKWEKVDSEKWKNTSFVTPKTLK